MSRENILSAIAKNQPETIVLPADLEFELPSQQNIVAKFTEMVNFIGGKVIPIKDESEIDDYINVNFKPLDRILTFIPELAHFIAFSKGDKPHDFENIELAILKPHFGVAENGAVWITEDQMGHRVIPFICQHLAIVVAEENILANMHEAYKLIEKQEYDFGTFIAGPSKTADIEQSLVLGAHGSRSMIIFLKA